MSESQEQHLTVDDGKITVNLRKPEGEKRLRAWLWVLIGVVAIMAGLLVFATVRNVRETSSINPYEIAVPGTVLDIDEDGFPVAEEGRLRLITERCNTTDSIVVLDIETSWIQADQGENHIVPGAPLSQIAVPPGGSLCDPPTSDAIVSGIDLPDEVAADPGVWAYHSEITVSECLDPLFDDRTGRWSCSEVGEVIDTVGWFSQDFRVGD